MMRLSTMMRVDGLVGEDGRSVLADQIAALWLDEPESVVFFRSSANFLYLLEHGGQKRFLRFADGSERQWETVAAEIALLEWLAEKGLPVARPVRSRHGRVVESLATRWGTFLAVVFDALVGEQAEIGELDETAFRDWGAALGRLHAVMADAPAAVAVQRPSLQQAVGQARQTLNAQASVVQEEARDIAAALDALPVHRGTYGLIHGDFELDNLVWQGRTPQMLDFDDAMRGWYAADIAFALRDRFEEGAAVGDADVRAFLNGYALHATLTDEQIAQIPLFSRLARLIQHARIARSLDVVKAPENPEWLNALIDRLQHRMALYPDSLPGSG